MPASADVIGRTESALARHEGDALLTGSEAIVKGLLESDLTIEMMAVSVADVFREVAATVADAGVEATLRANGTRAVMVPSARRGFDLARNVVRRDGNAVVLVDREALGGLRAAELGPDAGALVLLAEDDPLDPLGDPIHWATRQDLVCLVPEDLDQLRSMIEVSVQLGRAVRRPVVLSVPVDLIRSADVLDLRPNRAIDHPVEAMLLRRRHRRPRPAAGDGDFMRLIRRLELNRSVGLPSPGERVPLGFVTVGPAGASLRHLADTLGLPGRIPHVSLGVATPVDRAIVRRILLRSVSVAVLESRPGVVARAVLEVAESMRQSGETPATIWSTTAPAVEGADEPAPIAPGAAHHVSQLASIFSHSLRDLRPVREPRAVPVPVEYDGVLPPRGAGIGPGAAEAVVRDAAREVDRWLAEREPDGEDAGPITLAFDVAYPSEASDARGVPIEFWSARRFRREGVAAVRHAARQPAWILVVCDGESGDREDVIRLARGVVPAERVDRVRIVDTAIDDRDRLIELLREAALTESVTIVVVRDAPPARFDPVALSRKTLEIDRLGFEPRQRVVWSLDRACAIRDASDEDDAQSTRRAPHVLRSEVRSDQLPRRLERSVAARVRPILEEVEVMRTRPPAGRWQRDASARLPLPEAWHARSAQWRVHVAGWRGDAPGVLVRILAEAGRRMGYAVRVAWDDTSIGAGRRAWAQILFTRRRSGASLALSGRIPFGEADLVIGVDAIETLRAIVADPALAVARPGYSFAVVNDGAFADDAELEPARRARAALGTCLTEQTRAEASLRADVAAACRAWFHTDRVTDVVLAGTAFQLGLIPVTLDALRGAVEDAQRAGVGRAVDAFSFGRHVAVDRRLLVRPRLDRQDEISRLARRTARRAGRRRVGVRFAELVHSCVGAMPGLRETDRGRQALRDFIVGLDRARLWGGLELAEEYGRIVVDLYRVDRGAAGREMTRSAVLPLAGALLVRDPIYVATIATSGEQDRRTRVRLNVKRAREDQLTRRFLTRLELVVLTRRFRADIRSSDWLPRVLASLRFVVPRSWRGSMRERALREYVVDLVHRAAHVRDEEEYERLRTALHGLHEAAVANRLRLLTVDEAKIIATPESELTVTAGDEAAHASA